MSDAMSTLPHCTGCTEPGAVTHQQETVEHIHDGCPKLWACPECGFAFGAAHTDDGTDEYTCPVCEVADRDSQLTEANATIAALREAVRKALVSDHHDAYGQEYRFCSMCGTHTYCGGEAHAGACPLAQPIPPAAAKLLESAANEQAAYAERTHVVALLARVFPSGIRQTNIEGWDAEWNGCVYIDLPTGQISYHYHDSLAFLFEDLPPYTSGWDGHDKTQVWERQRAAYPAAAKLLAERDAGRALLKAAATFTTGGTAQAVWDAVQAYRKVVE